MNGTQWNVAVDSWFDPKKGDQQIEREFDIGSGASGGAGAPTTADEVPSGLTKMQEMAWRKENGR